MEKQYIDFITRQQDSIDEQLKLAQNQQYVEYVSSKLDDILKYQQQENQQLKSSKQLSQQTEELVGLASELEGRFQRTVKQLQLKQDQLEVDQVLWKQELKKKEQQQLEQLAIEKQNVDKQFKERLKTIHI